jgi:MFS transporter, DHA2 family, multidrug resistance protein
LVPSMLQTLLDYPVADSGLVTASSGIGTALVMLVVGRLIGKVDLRLMVAGGFALTAVSLWQMSRYSLDLSASDIVWPGLVQGLGMGLLFVPLSTAAFSSLDPSMRAQGAAIFSLVRNIGSSIGISLVQVLLVRGTERSHAVLVERITSDSPAWNNPGIAALFNMSDVHGAAALDAVVTQQAAMIAYINDFWFMCILTLAAMPLVLLIKPTRRMPTADETLVME